MVKKYLSIIVPMYNEQKMVLPCFNQIYDSMKDLTIEIIFVNDGSTDETQKITSYLEKTFPKTVVALSYYQNRGKGYAVQYGLMHSKYKQKLIVDADLSIKPDNIFKFDSYLATKSKHFVLKGNRKQVKKQPLYRIFFGKCWKLLVFTKTGLWIDSQAPFTVLHLPDEFYHDLFIEGFAFDVELLFKAKKLKYPIFEIDVEYNNNLDTRVTPKKTWEMFKDLMKIN